MSASGTPTGADLRRRRGQRSTEASAETPDEDLLADATASIGRGTTLLVVGTILLLALSFVGRVLVARLVSVEAWGEFNLGLAATGLVLVVAMLGMTQSIARTLSYRTDPGERWAVIRWSIAVTAGVSVVSSLAVYLLATPLAAVFHNPGLVPVFQLLSITIGFTIVSSVLAAIFQGFEDVRPNVWFNQILDPALFVVFLALFVLFHLRLTGVLWAYLLCNAVAMVAFIVYSVRQLPKTLPRPAVVPSSAPPELWHLTLAFWGVVSFNFLTGFADTLILGLYRPETTVGYYSAAMTLARLLILASQALTFIFLPVTARLLRRGDLGAIRRTYLLGTRWTILLLFPLFLLFFADPSLSLAAIFGQRYTPAALSLAVLSLAAFAGALLGPVNAALAGLGEARNQLAASSISAVVNIGLSLSLIPAYGLLGATAAWSVARILFPVLSLALLYRGYNLSPFAKTLFVPVAISLAIGLPAFYGIGLLHPPHWVVIPMVLGAAGLFVGVVLLTGTLLPGDLVFVEFAERVFGIRLDWLRKFLARRLGSPPAA